MTARPTPTNSRAARRAVRLLRRADRLDEVGEALGVLVETSAALVDEATGPRSDCAAYARAAVIRAHGQLLGQLGDLVGPVRGDPFEAFLAEISRPGRGASDVLLDDDDRM